MYAPLFLLWSKISSPLPWRKVFELVQVPQNLSLVFPFFARVPETSEKVDLFSPFLI